MTRDQRQQHLLRNLGWTAQATSDETAATAETGEAPAAKPASSDTPPTMDELIRTSVRNANGVEQPSIPHKQEKIDDQIHNAARSLNAKPSTARTRPLTEISDQAIRELIYGPPTNGDRP